VISISGYFVTDDATGAFTSATKIASQTPANYIKTAPKFRWYLAEGKDDATILIHGQAQLWSKKLASVKAPVALSLTPGGHTFAVVSDQMAPFAKWVKWTPTKPAPTPTVNPTSPTPTDSPTANPSESSFPLPLT
jgi:S-formylglutathione hydrolase FrmB